ncbi:CD3324 family protein [Beduini massiliensis]|uniref:CD3324 family protein n=1 Tax=Beduini massiliensis TaxID=1585974 RepID=UPI00059AAAE7|nr:CD3324 family protein [Beduini massiliensis]
MLYKNADQILPKHLVEEVQTYFNGGYIYIPIKKKKQCRWGERCGLRQEIDERNRHIKEAFINGKTIDQLADQYALSISAIQKIIYKKKK